MAKGDIVPLFEGFAFESSMFLKAFGFYLVSAASHIGI